MKAPLKTKRSCTPKCRRGPTAYHFGRFTASVIYCSALLLSLSQRFKKIRADCLADYVLID
eukprot:3752034-Prymnesium_polylepis.2